MYSEVERAGYIITEEGFVLSKKGKRLAGAIRERGYRTVSLRIDGKTKTYKVHRLVAWKHVPNPHNYKVVNHKDRNPSNCHKDNLEWCTQQENTIHAHYGCLNIDNKVAEAKRLREEGWSYPKIGRHFGLDHKTVWYWINGRRT